MSVWKRQSQEKEDQDYWFDGQCFLTKGVNEAIPKEEIIEMVHDVQKFALDQGGCDYLQIFVHERSGIKVWIIDQVPRLKLERGEHTPDQNYFTVLFPSEY